MESYLKMRWKFLAKVFLVVSVLVVIGTLVPMGGLTAFMGYRFKPDFPKTNVQKTYQLKGLQKSVSVLFDTHGVPHVEAKSEKDLVRAVGFLHGSQRFFQMDMIRRIAKGRVSELVGKQPFLTSDTVRFDLAMRGWGFERMTRTEWKRLTPNEHTLLEAYTQGVNAALNKFLPLEYRLLGIKPEPFSKKDMVAIGLLHAWSISHNWQQELVRFLLALEVGAKRAQQIYHHEPLIQGVSIKGGNARKLPPGIAPELLSMLPGKPYRASNRKLRDITRLAADMAATMHAASNAWVLSGKRTKSGMPMLASDPHMSHFLPSLVYQQHLKAPGLNVMGAGFPGLPYVFIGRNPDVAWGMTSAVADSMDLYIEKPDPKNAKLVLSEGRKCLLIRETLEIRVRNRKLKKMVTKKYTIRRTCRGPILNDLYPHLFPKDAPMVALRWNAGEAVKSIFILGKANRAKSVQELKQVLSKLATPVSTCQAVDKKGHIGIFWAGTVPARKHRGTFPVPGWLKKYEWNGSVPHSLIPSAMDAKSGYFAHANNLLSNPYKTDQLIQIDSAPPYRVRRIEEMILAKKKHDLDSFAEMQRDVKLRRAQKLLPHILAELGKGKKMMPLADLAYQELKKWNAVASADSPGAAIFFETYRLAIMSAIEDELHPAGIQFFMSQRYSTNVADDWFLYPNHVVWDHRGTKKVETRGHFIRKAFHKAVRNLKKKQGLEPARWRWGRLHKIQFKHFFGKLPLLGGYLNMKDLEGSGGLDSIWKSHFDMGHPKHPFKLVAGPVVRMLVDMGNPSKSKWISDSGQSGWPGSPNYGDQLKKWHKGEYIPMVMDWKLIKKQAVGKWQLVK